MAALGMKIFPLYGGNMSVMLPANAKDVSEVRQVPDNQEVFVHPDTDQSIIVEVLEYVQEPDEQAIRTHFEDLAVSNEAEGENANIFDIEIIPMEQRQLKQCECAYSVCSEQLVAKFKESARNQIQVYMGLFRLVQHDADILVTFNNPLSISPQSSSKSAVVADIWTRDHFRQVLTSLQLLNPEFLG